MVEAVKPVLLEVDGLAVLRGGRWILRNFDLKVRGQEIIGIVGPNGAGKTTLLAAIAGQLRPQQGTIRFKERAITSWPPHRRCRLGIVRTFQIPRPFPQMTAWENIALAQWFGRERRACRTAGKSEVMPLLDLVGLPRTKAETLGRDLTLSEQRRLEVARALAARPELLLLDEVAAGLSPKMVDQVARLIQKLRREGLTIVIIDHFLNLVLEVSDRLVALDRGAKIAEGEPAEVIRQPEVVGAYLGTRRRDSAA